MSGGSFLTQSGSFEPTYEGWKLTTPLRYTFPPPCFEPTYEGWKLRTKVRLLEEKIKF